MTTTEDIANLIGTNTALKAYFEGAKSEIQSELAAAIAAFPKLHKLYWVDPATGNDLNAGSEAAPFASIKAAIAAVPENGSGLIRLLGDITLPPERQPLTAKAITILGPDGGPRPTITLSAYEAGGTARLSGWGADLNAGILLRGVKVAFPTYTGTLPADPQYSAIVGPIGAFSKMMLHFGAADIDFIRPVSNGFGSCGTLTASALTFVLNQTTDVNGNMGGAYVIGANVTNPGANSNLVTNMTAL
ncbi:hypothetical protein [Profundibacterium mesophilum]|uniref:Uncharacterized protein n=1 Tax=Profundibacterium mesophilum KAUST100406-0324 TaxID=1037889 RepID=A0A921P040_9RHOB|nr:hypothetical protein [Profundibacterium mesophilum]KAF0676733.1 hypothetical protein PMES_00920 [Profundibacterium mesophilum KAUST100406-0324]